MKINIENKSDVFSLEIQEGMGIEDVIEVLGLQPGETGICAVNGAIVTKGYVLKEGDCLKIFPYITGG